MRTIPMRRKRSMFQLTAARRRLLMAIILVLPNLGFQLTAARRRLPQ